MVPVSAFLIFLPIAWTCPRQKAGNIDAYYPSTLDINTQIGWKERSYDGVFFSDYVIVSCFPNAIIASVPECPYGWEIDQLSLGGVCYTGIHSQGYYRFIISDLTPKNHSYCGTQSEVSLPGSEDLFSFYALHYY